MKKVRNARKSIHKMITKENTPNHTSYYADRVLEKERFMESSHAKVNNTAPTLMD